MDRSVEETIARNQTLMGEVSRAMEALAGEATDEIDLVCECGDIACFETVRVTVSEFEAVRASGAFVLAPEHATPESEGELIGVPSL